MRFQLLTIPECAAMPISSALVCVCQVGWYWYTVFSAAPRCSPHTVWVIRSQQRQGFPSLWAQEREMMLRFPFVTILYFYLYPSVSPESSAWDVHPATSQSHCRGLWPLLNAEGINTWRSWCRKYPTPLRNGLVLQLDLMLLTNSICTFSVVSLMCAAAQRSFTAANKC